MYPPKWPEMTVPKREGDQWHPTNARGARSKSGTTPSARPTTVSGAKPKHHTMLDPIEQPKDLVRAYTMTIMEPPKWWLEVLSLYWGVQVSSPQPLYSSWPRDRVWVSSLLQPMLKNKDGGILPQPQCSMLQWFPVTWGLQGLLGHLWGEERKNPGPSQSPAELFWLVWWAL